MQPSSSTLSTLESEWASQNTDLMIRPHPAGLWFLRNKELCIVCIVWPRLPLLASSVTLTLCPSLLGFESIIPFPLPIAFACAAPLSQGALPRPFMGLSFYSSHRSGLTYYFFREATLTSQSGSSFFVISSYRTAFFPFLGLFSDKVIHSLVYLIISPPPCPLLIYILQALWEHK